MRGREPTATWAVPTVVIERWRRLTEGLGTERVLAPGDVLFRQGEPSHDFFLASSGLLKAVAVTPSGSERLLEIMGPGCLFGEGPTLEDGPRLVTVSAASRATVRAYGAAEVRAAAKRDPEIALCLVLVVAAKQRSLMHRLIQASTLAPEEQLLVLFEKVRALRVEGSGPIELRLTHEEIAGYLGLARITVTRALGRLRRADLLPKGHGLASLWLGDDAPAR